MKRVHTIYTGLSTSEGAALKYWRNERSLFYADLVIVFFTLVLLVLCILLVGALL